MSVTTQRLSSVLDIPESSIHTLSKKSYQVDGKTILVSELQPASSNKFVGLTTQKVLESDFVLIFIEENQLTPRAVLNIPATFFTEDFSKFYGEDYRLLFNLEHVDFSGWYMNLKDGHKVSMAQYELPAYSPNEIMEKAKQVQNILYSHLNSKK